MVNTLTRIYLRDAAERGISQKRAKTELRAAIQRKQRAGEFPEELVETV
jgi:hypothetical protein